MATDTLTKPVIAGGTTTTKVFKNFIDGEWVESASGKTFEDRNPADTREVVAIFQRSNKDDVDAAVDAAKRAFAKWRLVPAPRRAEMVFRAAEILIERKEEHARDMTREMGKVLKETRGDVQEAITADAEIDEGGLNAGFDIDHFPLVNVAHVIVLARPLDIEFLEHSVFNDRDPAFFRLRDVDQHFLLHVRCFLALGFQ